jgi:hypothetical protein
MSDCSCGVRWRLWRRNTCSDQVLRPILTAGYEGFTKRPWSELADTSREFITVLFRLYGAYNVAVALLAIAITITAFRRGEGGRGGRYWSATRSHSARQ